MERAILKTCQVMRDYKRPDRLIIRSSGGEGDNMRGRERKRQRVGAVVQQQQQQQVRFGFFLGRYFLVYSFSFECK